MVVFADRVDAGRQLARHLESFRGEDVVVLGLPRGGVPVAFEVATALDAPLDVVVVRKLGVPFQPELAMGAIGENGARVIDSEVMALAGVTDTELRIVEARERAVLTERATRLRRGRRRVDLRGRTAVIVDDGLATGSTARAACQVARQLGASRVVVAVPVAAAPTVQHLTEADTVVAVSIPDRFLAVGLHYRDFTPTSDEEVIVLLDKAQRRIRSTVAVGGAQDCGDDDVQIPVGDCIVDAHLHLSDATTAMVVFAHGSGSSRHSPRNRFVADVLHRAAFGTLLLDLLTPEEELRRTNVFDIDLLARRLLAAIGWLGQRPDTRPCRVGIFGASTGAAAALCAAAEPDSAIAAVVSRGGRPDLAGPYLSKVRAPTLLIVGGRDDHVLALNRQAQSMLRCHSQLSIIEGATHLFEEPGTLAEAATLAAEWFTRYLCPTDSPPDQAAIR